jgi:hypothetical protein
MTPSPAPISAHLDDRTAFHTAARRYCEDRFSEWTQKYADLQAKENFKTENLFKPGWDYSEEAYAIFPQYRFEKATRIEVERLLPRSSKSLDEMPSQLMAASDTAESRLSAELKNEIALKTLREESDDYKTYVRILSEADLLNIAPLPFRRVLAIEESKEIWNQLKAAWEIREGYWFPLREGPIPPNILAFHVDYFNAMNGVDLLRDALGRRGISRVFQLHEFGPDEADYEIELSIFEPAYRSVENNIRPQSERTGSCTRPMNPQ